MQFHDVVRGNAISKVLIVLGSVPLVRSILFVLGSILVMLGTALIVLGTSVSTALDGSRRTH